MNAAVDDDDVVLFNDLVERKCTEVFSRDSSIYQLTLSTLVLAWNPLEEGGLKPFLGRDPWLSGPLLREVVCSSRRGFVVHSVSVWSKFFIEGGFRISSEIDKIVRRLSH